MVWTTALKKVRLELLIFIYTIDHDMNRVTKPKIMVWQTYGQMDGFAFRVPPRLGI